jgi:photosystem II stability/assembly factor-like uncharacterized protein
VSRNGSGFIPGFAPRLRLRLFSLGVGLGIVVSSLSLAAVNMPASAGGGGGGGFLPSLNSVSFVDGSTGWAVGSGSNGPTILATTDGGGHWSPQTVPGSLGQLAGVSFVSSSLGWAVGQGQTGGGIIATDNGGANWASQAVPGGVQNLNAVSFVNSTTGWAVGAGGSGAVILATTDGGATWNPQTVPGGVGNLNGLSFLNSTTGFAVGGGGSGAVILSTVDGGATWTPRTVPGGVGSLMSVSFANVATGWAVGQGGTGGKILVTTDGGTTWTAQSVPGGVGSLNGVSFASSSTGWAVGSNSGFTRGVILATTNGGATWSPQTAPASNQQLGAVSAIGNSAWAVGTGSCLSFSILATTNGGSAWAEQLSQTPTQPSTLQSVSFVSATAGWAVGTDSCGLGAIVATTDGGSNWTNQATPAGTGGLSGVFFADSSHGWAVGNSAGGFGPVILATTNGGGTWTSQAVPNNINNLSAVTFVSNTAGWAVGQGFGGGVILATVDGGTTWTPQTVPSGVGSLSGVKLVDSTHGWAVGVDQTFNTAVILATTDGSTWTAQTVPGGTAVLNAVTATSTTTAWAVGSGSNCCGPPVILGTTNSGGTWSAQSAPGQLASPLGGVSFTNSSVGWTVDGGGGGGGGQAGIAATTNGGALWSAQTVPNGVGFLNGVAAVSTSHAWAVGGGPNGAVIVATTDGGTNWTSQAVELVGPVSPSLSTVSAAPGSVPADGTMKTTITVTLRDAHGNFAPGRTVTLGHNGSATVSGSPATTSSDGQASFTASDITAQNVVFSATDTTDSVPITATATVAFTPLVAVSNLQYSLANSDGATWQDMDVSNLALSVSPSANSVAIISANADLFTASAGFNQDIGIYVSPSDVSSYPANIVAWKESGGFAGTFSPNAAFVEAAIPMSMGTTYTIKLRWKTNKNAAGATIYAGAGPWPAGSGQFSPTRLAVSLVPASSSTLVQSARTTAQYTLANSDGTTWQDVDAANLSLPVTPPNTSANWMALVSGNADLFTASPGFNQDLGINVTPSNTTTYPGNVVAWKESGGFAGTFSPNAAYAQGAFPMTGGSAYNVKLQWKANKNAAGATIYAGAGPSGGLFSPTRLTVVLVPLGGSATATSVRSTSQYTLASSDGNTWKGLDTDPTNLKLPAYAPASSGTVVVSANADLFTASSGVNQDIAIFVSVDGAADQIVAWKESGGFAGTFSPNAAFVQASYSVATGHSYVFKIKWKTNQNAPGATIYAGAGPWPSPGALFSPTLLTLRSS